MHQSGFEIEGYLKTKVITLANHNRGRQSRKPIKTGCQIHVAGAKGGKTRASKSRLAFGFTPDWLRKNHA